MQYSFWYKYQPSTANDLMWLEESLYKLRTNEWDGSKPLFLDGVRWEDDILREQAAISLLQNLSWNKSVRSLVIRNANMDVKVEKCLMEVFQQNSSLESVSLRSIRSGARPLTVPSALFQNESLQSLTLENVILDEEGCDQLGCLLRESHNLMSLSLTAVSFTTKNNNNNEGLQTFTNALSMNHSLTTLCLIHMDSLSLEDFTSLFHALAMNTSITSVTLDHMDLTQQHAYLVANMISHNTQLQILSLRKNSFNDPAIKIIMEHGMGHNHTLEKLYLSRNPIQESGIQSIIQCLQTKNHSLDELCLSYCNIGHIGCCNMFQGLSSFKGLRILNMTGNDVFNSMEEVLQAVQINMRIKDIILGFPSTTATTTRLLLCRHQQQPVPWNDIALVLWNQVQQYLRWNNAHRIVLANNDPRMVSTKIPIIMEQHSNDYDIIYRFLQNIPDLITM